MAEFKSGIKISSMNELFIITFLKIIARKYNKIIMKQIIKQNIKFIQLLILLLLVVIVVLFLKEIKGE